MKKLRLGVDVGGTFTDFVLIVNDEEILLHKRLSTPIDPSIGVVAGLREMAEIFAFNPADLNQIVHGTTVVANALIERKGSPTGLLATRGHSDAIEIGREVRYDIYDLAIENPQPLAPRLLRRELDERMLADGTVRLAVDPAQVIEQARSLIEAGAQSIAVCLIHSYRNRDNEQKVGEVLRINFPHLRVTLSSDVAPEIREFERMSTTLANAYVHPLVDRYMQKLQDELTLMGFNGSLLIMLSHGGVASVDYVRENPIQLIESGPAAGVQACSAFSRQLGWPHLMTFDMGGTTAKVSLLDEGEPTYTMDTEVARIRRFKKGSGLPLKVPSVEMIEIGAGGGSIGRIDGMGLLKIGPDSAGASPGPVCYGLGGTEPTVTDADVVLGYLNPDNFLGGRLKLDPTAAMRVIHSRLALPLGLSEIEAAAGMVALANENMATAARLHVAERGKDPLRYSLMAFGGAGPVHAVGVAKALRLKRIIFPMGAGALSAFGFLVSPAATRLVRSYISPLESIDWVVVDGLLDEMHTQAIETMVNTGVNRAELRMRFSVDMRYSGQGHELDVPIDFDQVLQRHDSIALREAFERAYFELFTMKLDALAVEALNWRLICQGPSPDAPFSAWSAPTQGNAASALMHYRSIYIPAQSSFVEAPVYDRYQLARGTCFDGPAIIEERESTVVINCQAKIEVDAYANILVDID